MELATLDEIASLDEKDTHQMITLVDTSHLDGGELVDNSAPLVHHVLEPSEVSFSMHLVILLWVISFICNLFIHLIFVCIFSTTFYSLSFGEVRISIAIFINLMC